MTKTDFLIFRCLCEDTIRDVCFLHFGVRKQIRSAGFCIYTIFEFLTFIGMGHNEKFLACKYWICVNKLYVFSLISTDVTSENNLCHELLT